MPSVLVIVDFENVQNIKSLSSLSDLEIKILIGKSQNRIPLETVQVLQKFGSLLEWIKVPGQGKNALDFFVAYFLGKYIQENKYIEYKIISKDTGYDPLIEYLKDGNIKIERLTSVEQLKGNNDFNSQVNSADFDLVVEKIKKIDIKARPKKRASLISHLATALKNKKTKGEIAEIIEVFFEKKILIESNGQLKYVGIEIEEN